MFGARRVQLFRLFARQSDRELVARRVRADPREVENHRDGVYDLADRLSLRTVAGQKRDEIGDVLRFEFVDPSRAQKRAAPCEVPSGVACGAHAPAGVRQGREPRALGLGEERPGDRIDAEGLRSSNALVAWLDGPIVDDGTACEIGMFAELVRRGGDQYRRGIVAISTDIRLERRRQVNVVVGGMNLFVAGAIESCGRTCHTVDEVLAALRRRR